MDAHTDITDLKTSCANTYMYMYPLTILFDADLFFLCRFDLILDTVGGDTPHYSLDLLKTWRNSKYVSIVSPLLSNTDSLGVPGGLLKSIGSLGSHLLKVNRCNVY